MTFAAFLCFCRVFFAVDGSSDEECSHCSSVTGRSHKSKLHPKCQHGSHKKKKHKKKSQASATSNTSTDSNSQSDCTTQSFDKLPGATHAQIMSHLKKGERVSARTPWHSSLMTTVFESMELGQHLLWNPGAMHSHFVDLLAWRRQKLNHAPNALSAFAACGVVTST